MRVSFFVLCVYVGFSDEDRILTENLYILKVIEQRKVSQTAGTEKTFEKLRSKSRQNETAAVD